MLLLLAICASFLQLLPNYVFASVLPVPRFVSIKFNEVNARTGPEYDCPIEWVFIKKSEPVEIVAEYGQWRKIRDINNEGGWVHASALSGKRFVIITGDKSIELLKILGDYNSVIANIMPDVRCKLNKCQGDWCQVECMSYKGWVVRKTLWGLYPEEWR